MSLKWNQELSSGIEAIDRQHQQILHLLEQLVIANQSPDNKERLINSLEEFNKAIQEHFDFEEALLAESGFRDLKRHKAGHEEIAETLNSITMSVMFDDSDISSEMINRVIRWFEEHLTSEDTRYFKSVKKSLSGA